MNPASRRPWSTLIWGAQSNQVAPPRKRCATAWRCTGHEAGVSAPRPIAFAMPVGPRAAVAAHDTPTRHTVTVKEADDLNQMQRRVAVSHLYRRPE